MINKKGLLNWQQKVLDFKGKNLICNWCRNAGKNFTIAKIIELETPKNVLYIDSFDNNSLKILCESFNRINELSPHNVHMEVC